MTVDVFSQWILWDIWSVGGDKEGEADRSTVRTGQGRDSPAAFGFIGQESRWGAATWLLKAAVLWLAADNMACATTVAGNKNHPFPSFKKKTKTPKSLTKYCVSCVIRTMCLETAGVWSWMQISLVPLVWCYYAAECWDRSEVKGGLAAVVGQGRAVRWGELRRKHNVRLVKVIWQHLCLSLLSNVSFFRLATHCCI